MSAIRFAPVIAVALLVLRSYSTAADFSLPPLFGGEGTCSDSVCGKGKCVTKNSTFGFECKCEAGWRQARSDDADGFKFLPCVIPNCTMNHSCDNTSDPSRRDQDRNGSSIFDPCFWADCGGGSCNKTSPFTRTCICEQGYYNLFNSTSFPCYKQCAIGLDCAKLGINIMNSSNPSSNMNDNSENHGTSLIPRIEFSWSIALATGSALVWLMYS
ncbi:uncharacterized protein LOC127249217 [Andrographis paniculata]|uniref:uncharacterized protein LOC127249217 n=1 Tax=Andrographis paniculata TaxID=175694 RepID=UPI0021E72176|nr:uncharacterized protein LOC127249217 [Andrographis paniculata]